MLPRKAPADDGSRNIGVSVDDLPAACERFDKVQVPWMKRLREEPRKGALAFMLDPDGYCIELVQNSQTKST